MPIDRSGRPEPVGQPPQGAEPGPLDVEGTLRTDRHQAAHLEAEVACSPRRPRRRGAGAHPPCCGAPLTFTWTRTAAPGARRATSAASDRRSMDCHRCTSGAIWRTLLRCRLPIQCHRGLARPLRRSLERGGLVDQLLGVALADVGQRRPSIAARTSAAGCPLVTATMRTRGRVAPGGGDARSRTPATALLGTILGAARSSCGLDPGHGGEAAGLLAGPVAEPALVARGAARAVLEGIDADLGQRGAHGGREVQGRGAGGRDASARPARSARPRPRARARRTRSSRGGCTGRGGPGAGASPSAAMASTVRATSPACRPRHPRWSTADRRGRPTSTTGAQSAVRTASAHPGWR